MSAAATPRAASRGRFILPSRVPEIPLRPSSRKGDGHAHEQGVYGQSEPWISPDHRVLDPIGPIEQNEDPECGRPPPPRPLARSKQKEEVERDVKKGCEDPEGGPVFPGPEMPPGDPPVPGRRREPDRVPDHPVDEEVPRMARDIVPEGGPFLLLRKILFLDGRKHMPLRVASRECRRVRRSMRASLPPARSPG